MEDNEEQEEMDEQDEEKMKTSDEVEKLQLWWQLYGLTSSVSSMNSSDISKLPVNPLQGTAGQEVTAYEEMSALVNYIQPQKFISFDNARSNSLLSKFDPKQMHFIFF